MLTSVSGIRVALVNDYEIVLQGLRALLLPHEPDIRVVEMDIKRDPVSDVDVTLFDTYGAQDGDMLGRIRKLADDPSNGALAIFSFSDHADFVEELMRLGARGFISKAAPGPAIVEGIRQVAAGQPVLLRRRAPAVDPDARLKWPGRDIGLSGRESELLALLPTGLTNRELAARLYVSENTIKTQLRHLYAKLGVRNRVQASTRAASLLGVNHRQPAHEFDGSG
jgi:two-component system, NarL family, response regulator LiaR